MDVRFSQASQDDLEDLVRYLVDSDAPEAAAALEQRLKHVIELLSEHPLVGSLRDELGQDVRAFPLRARVVLFYEITEEAGIECVDVLRILDARRDLAQLL